MKELIYPISLNYRKHWTEWEAIRELIQNSLDTEADFEIKQTNDALIIRDYGEGLKLKHLLFGVSEKATDEARGKFGEGLKIALIVLKRLGYEITILSNGLKVRVDEGEIAGEKCLKLTYEEIENGLDGTLIEVKGYRGETFEDRFNIGNRKQILFVDNKSMILDEKPAKLYVKNIYVTNIENGEFSYDLWNLRLEESRNIASEWDLKHELSKLWGSVNKPELLKRLFRAIKAGKWESEIKFREWFIRSDDKPKWLEAFKKVFGDNAVIETDEDWSREAKWRGANPIKLDCLADLHFLGTDKSYVTNFEKGKDIKIVANSLELSERKILAKLTKLVRKFNIKTNNHLKIGVYLMTNTEGKLVDNEIRINKSVLGDEIKAISVLIHELGHSFGTQDLTIGQILAIAKVGAILLSN